MQTRNSIKRELEAVELNESRKKLKQDDGDDDDKVEISKYINIKWNEINVNELDGLPFKDLRIIGKSIGISLNSITKVRLISRIKYIVGLNNESIEKKNIQDTNNPFNKSTYGQLIITSDKQGQDELLFWKLFKNKTIFKTIMSFMNVIPNSIPYDHIISVKEMMDNNQISILKDKVHRNKFISFYSNSKIYVDILSVPLIESLFSRIQDDKSFYQSLFTNYMNELTGRGDIFKITVDSLISTNCLIGYKALISSPFKYKPTSNDLQNSINFSKWEFANFIISQLKDSQIIGSGKGYPKYNKEIKLSENIKSMNEYLNSYKQYSTADNINDIIKNGWFQFKNVDPMKIKLKNLIKWVELYELLDPQYQVFKESIFEYPSFYSKFYFQLYQMEFKEIKSFKFSTTQLKSNVNDQINYKSDEKFNIIKLIHVLYKVIFRNVYSYNYENNLPDHYICYNGLTEDPDKLHQSISKITIFPRAAIEYGNYSKFIKCANHGGLTYQIGSSLIYEHHQYTASTDDRIAQLYDREYGNPKVTNIPKNILFSKCQNDKELQINFINSAIQDIKSNDIKLFKLKPMFLFIMLISFDNLELVKLFVNQLGKEHIRITRTNAPINKYNCFSFSITKYIKSIDMLDYIFNEFNNLIIQNQFYNNVVNNGGDGNDFIRCQFTNVNLLKHFQTLCNDHVDCIGKLLWVNIPAPRIDIIEHVLTNSNHFGKINKLLLKEPIDFNGNQHRYFSILKQSIELLIQIQFNPLLFYISTKNIKNSLILGQYPPQSFIKYLIWLNEYPSYKLEFSDKTISRLVQYFITNQQDYQIILKEIAYNEIINNFCEIIKHSITRGDLTTLSTLLNCLLNAYDTFSSKLINGPKIDKNNNTLQLDSIKKFILIKILRTIVLEDQFLVLEYLYFNYNRILKKKTTTTSKSKSINTNDQPLFTFSDLQQIISRSRYNTQINKLLNSITK